MVRIGVEPGQWGWTFGELESSWRAVEEVRFSVALAGLVEAAHESDVRVRVRLRDVDLRTLRGRLARLEEAGAASATVVLVEERGPDAVRRLAEAVL